MDVCIEAAGLACALGSLEQAHAAFAAGLSGARASREFHIFERGDEAPQPAIVFEAQAVTFGFRGVGRLVALLAQSLADLEQRVGRDQVAACKHWLFALPDPEARGMSSISQAQDPAARVRQLGEAVAARVASARGLACQASEFLHAESSSSVAALARAAELVRGGGRALVFAADSLVEPHLLQDLLERERLKTPRANPTGCMPGEAGIVLLVSEGGVESKSGRLRVREWINTSVDGPRGGADLAENALSVLQSCGRVDARPLIAVDLDGSESRARQWGEFQSELTARGYQVDAEHVWFPSIGLGCVGEAFALLAAALAIQAVVRGIADTGGFVVMASGSERECGLLGLVAEGKQASLAGAVG